MSDRAAFLSHIADHPDADLPRLVFADWLDERNDPLGEFIRVQIELSHRQHALGDPDTQELLKREDELLAEHREVWSDGWNLMFERGLPHKVRLKWPDLRDRAESLFDCWPTLRVASVATDSQVQAVQVVAGVRHFHRVPELHLEGWPSWALVNGLLASPHWNPATALRLNFHPDGPNGTVTTLRPHAAVLRRVELIQPYPAYRAGAFGDTEADRAVAELVREFNAFAGREVAVLSRPYVRLYPLLGEIGGGFFAGHLKSGAAALFGITGNGRQTVFCTFTDEGRVDKSLWEDTVFPPWTLDRICDRFGFELGFIRVREFEANNRLAVRFWERSARAIYADATFDEVPDLSNHLADPREFFVGFGEREVRVAYRTGRGTGAVR